MEESTKEKGLEENKQAEEQESFIEVSEPEKKSHKFIIGAAALLVIIGLSVGVTYAREQNSWLLDLTGTSGEAVNAGGRLHDDWNGETKKIYMENFLGTGGDSILVRIRVEEYMEFGEDSGEKTESERVDVKPVVPTARIDDTSTWNVHILNGNTTPFQVYLNIELGSGTTWYKPTANKSTSSLEPDVNGTYEGSSGIHFNDYKGYTSTSSGAKETLRTEKVISMEDWLDLSENAKIGNFWVWDEDGWAYWAQPLAPQTATGPLLNKVTLREISYDRCYYAFNIIAQSVSVNDWGTEGDASVAATGFYMDGITDNAITLLTKAKASQ